MFGCDHKRKGPWGGAGDRRASQLIRPVLHLPLAALAVSGPATISSAQPAIFMEISGYLQEREGGGSGSLQQKTFSDSGVSFTGSEEIEWVQDPSTGTVLGGASAVWSAARIDYRTTEFTCEISSNFSYSHNGGWPFLIHFGDADLRLDVYLLGPAGTQAQVEIGNTVAADSASGTTIGWLCSGGWLFYQTVTGGSGDFTIRTTTDTVTYLGETYTHLCMWLTTHGQTQYGNTGPNQDPFLYSEAFANAVTFRVTHLSAECPADLTSDGFLDVFDLLAYLDLWFAGDAAAERTGDDPASIDVLDLLAYLDEWFMGC